MSKKACAATENDVEDLETINQTVELMRDSYSPFLQDLFDGMCFGSSLLVVWRQYRAERGDIIPRGKARKKQVFARVRACEVIGIKMYNNCGKLHTIHRDEICSRLSVVDAYLV
jgi:hypothetical protein